MSDAETRDDGVHGEERTSVQFASDQEVTRNRWKTRRAMTITSFVVNCSSFLYVLVFIPAADIEKYTTLLGSFSTFTGVVMGTYIGLSTYDDVKLRDQQIKS